jgi:shikimate dehydrogenase
MNTGATTLAGVIGWPIAHSLSPKLHGFWLKETRIEGAYVPLAVQREDFATVVRGLMRAGFTGVNVTVPHKEAALALAHSCNDAAQKAGAANLLIFDGDRIEARNTDSAGLAASLETLARSFAGANVVLLGAGGAARAAIFSLDRLGAAEVRILNRNSQRAEAMAAALQPHIKARLSVFGFDQWPAAAASTALLVNATSAGMKNAAPLSLSIDALPRDAAVCDLVYNPLETVLLRDAKSRGHKTLNGLGMLVHQAVPAFEAFFGVRPKVTDALFTTLEDSLRG